VGRVGNSGYRQAFAAGSIVFVTVSDATPQYPAATLTFGGDVCQWLTTGKVINSADL